MSSLAWALRVSGFVGILAVVAVTQLARLSGPDAPPARVALDARHLPSDPETTGAIPSVGAVRATVLNPCVAPVADRLRP